MALNYVKYELILVSAVTGCVSFSASTFLVGFAISILSSGVGLKICVITAVIKKLLVSIQKNKEKTKKKTEKKNYKIVFSAKNNLNTIEILISNVLISSNNESGCRSSRNEYEFLLVNDALKE